MKFSKVEIENIQKTLFQNMKKKALAYEGSITEELKSYRKTQNRYGKRNFKISTDKELFNKIENSDVIYLGDFHTLDQNTKNLERILRFLAEKKIKTTFGLEFIFTHQQQKVENYLKGHLTELEFLESINYQNSWKFPWKHYNPFFDFSKKNKIPILALNSKGTLKQRDESAAKIISDFIEKNHDHKIIVLFGELHIMPNKIPKIVSRLTQRPLRQLIIHQNLDEVFWKINNTELSIIKFEENEFSLQSSPPWIKYESMICWFENLIYDPENDLHEYILDRGVESLSCDVSEKLLFFSLMINQILGLGIEKTDLENFNILGFRQLDPILKKIKSFKNLNLEIFFKKLITNGLTFNLPNSVDYYCPNYSINKITALSGIHLRNINLQIPLPIDEKLNSFLHFFGNFFASYFSIKIFNPFIKCDLYQDISIKCESPIISFQEKKSLAFTKHLLDLLDKQDLKNKEFEPKTLFEIYESAKIIGYFFSEVFQQRLELISSKNKDLVRKKVFMEVLDLQGLYKISSILFSDAKMRSFKKRYF